MEARHPGIFLLTTVNRMVCGGALERDVVGKLTELRIVPVSKKSTMVLAAIAAAASSASSVDAPRCGNMIEFL